MSDKQLRQEILDVFQWDPGDGSDTIEGQAGADRMLFNGANVNEKIDISANGERVRFTRSNVQHPTYRAFAELGLFATQKRLIAIRDPGNLTHLHRYLSERDDAEIIALTVRTEKGLASSDGGQIFSAAEEKLFSKVVKVCEDHGRAVTPLVVVSNDQVYAIARMAFLLSVDEVVMGASERFNPDIQLENFAMHWGSLGDSDEHHVNVRVLSDNQDIRAEI